MISLNDFRKALADSRQRSALGFKLSDSQAAAILADDVLLQSRYRQHVVAAEAARRSAAQAHARLQSPVRLEPSMTFDEFKKAFADPARRGSLGVALSDRQTAEILATDHLIQSQYRKYTAGSTPRVANVGGQIAATATTPPVPPRRWLLLGAAVSAGVVLVIVLVVAGIGNRQPDNEVEAVAGPESVSSCEASVMKAADIPAAADANAELIATASACSSVAEWVAAVREHPEAMGQVDGSVIDPEFDLVGICGFAASTPVCVDAAARGLDTYWGGE